LLSNSVAFDEQVRREFLEIQNQTEDMNSDNYTFSGEEAAEAQTLMATVESHAYEEALAQGDNKSSAKAPSKQAQDVCIVHREVMAFTLHVLDKEFGGPVEYLKRIGFGPDKVEILRDILVEPEVTPPAVLPPAR